MFGSNEIVGRNFFAKADGRLLVTSMFLTLQGEGPYQGRPAFFVRLAKCNLACNFCDTFFDQGDWFEPDNLIDRIYSRLGGRKNVGLVITGGEPSLQTALPDFLRRLDALRYVSFMQIESNGIIPFEQLDETVTLVVSPKCNEVNNKPTHYLRPNPRSLARANCLKFIISGDPASPYYHVPRWAEDWMHEQGKPVYLSPMNVYKRMPMRAAHLREPLLFKQPDLATRSTVDEVVSWWEPGLLNMDENKRNHEYAAKYALAHGFWLTLQQQLYCSVA